MLNPDSNRNDFETWLSTGLKKPIPVSDHFIEQLLDRFEKQKTHQLLRYNFKQKKVFGNWISILILLGFGALLYPIVSKEIPAFINRLLSSLGQLSLQPSIESFAIPAAVVCVTAVILWNLLEMLSLE